MLIKENLLTIQKHMAEACDHCNRNPEVVQLLAVTKKASVEQIKTLLSLGQNHFGENRLDHLQTMANALSAEDITWYFIGHLQRNKVKQVLRYCSWVQSVDSLRLIAKLQQEAENMNQSVNVLLQMNMSGETQKTGFAMNEFEQAVQETLQCSHLNLRGLMCMAPQYASPEEAKDVFKACADLFNQIKQRFHVDSHFDTLSMGMSSDFPMAIECGATQIRIGTRLYAK